MRLAEDRDHVVLAMGLDRDVPEHDHVVVALDFLEGTGQLLVGVFVVALEELLIGADDAARRIEQALARRIVACPRDQRAHGFFRLFAARLLQGGGASFRQGRAQPVNCSIHVHTTIS
jgi:hypothetical protein